MKILNYKGIRFDDFTQNEDGSYWAEICEECVKKYSDLCGHNIDDGGTACGCCSVCECSNNGNDNEKKHYYIDFDSNFVTITTV